MDPIDDAKALMKKHAASALARKEELEAKLAKLVAQRTKLRADRARADAAGAVELRTEVDDVLGTLEAQIESLEGQAAMAANTFDDVVGEMKELDGSRSQLERDALVGKVRALSGSDPFSMDPTDRALANVRDHAAELDATLEVEAGISPESERAFRVLEKQDKEAALRAQLDALKAAKRGKAEPAEEAEVDAKDPLTKPKRTL